MTTFKLKTLWDSQTALSKLLICNIPIKKAFAAKKMGRQIESELRICNELRNDIIKSIGIDNGKGGFVVPSATEKDCEIYGWTMERAIEANKKLSEDLTALFDSEVDIEIVKITMDELEENDNALSISDLILLEDFIDG